MFRFSFSLQVHLGSVTWWWWWYYSVPVSNAGPSVDISCSRTGPDVFDWGGFRVHLSLSIFLITTHLIHSNEDQDDCWLWFMLIIWFYFCYCFDCWYCSYCYWYWCWYWYFMLGSRLSFHRQCFSSTFHSTPWNGEGRALLLILLLLLVSHVCFFERFN